MKLSADELKYLIENVVPADLYQRMLDDLTHEIERRDAEIKEKDARIAALNRKEEKCAGGCCAGTETIVVKSV